MPEPPTSKLATSAGERASALSGGAFRHSCSHGSFVAVLVATRMRLWGAAMTAPLRVGKPAAH